jgi:hypothetical protein
MLYSTTYPQKNQKNGVAWNMIKKIRKINLLIYNVLQSVAKIIFIRKNMIIYFDESYDNERKWLLLWATFNPHPKFLHKKILEIKKSHNFVGKDGNYLELKYSRCKDKKNFTVAKECIDAFFESTSYFRVIVVEQWAEWFDINKFWYHSDDKKLKTAKMYKKFAELLIKHNTENLFNAILLTDELTRCNKDLFFELMKWLFCIPWEWHSINKKEPTLKDIKEVRSDLEEYQSLQIADFLTWCVLNHLIPTKNKYKTNISAYVASKVWRSLTREEWVKYSKKYVEEFSPKFNIWFWKPDKN